MLSSLRTISFRSLICITLALIGLGTIALGITVMSLRQDALRDAEDHSSNIATILAEQMTRSVQSIDIVMSHIAERVGDGHALAATGKSADFLRSDSLHQFLAERADRLPQLEFIGILDHEGRLVSSSRERLAPDVDLSDRDYFIQARENASGTIIISNPIHNRVSDRKNIFFIKRISGPLGEFLGIAVAGITPAYFEEIYGSLTSILDQTFLLLRTDGTLLVRYPDPDGLVGQKIRSDSRWYDIVKQGGGHYTTRGYADGIVRLVSVRPLHDYPLVINVGVSEARALAAWKYRALTLTLGTLLTLICSLLLLYALNARFAELARSKTRLAEREAALAAQSKELEDANCRVDRAINHMVQGLSMFDADCKLVVSNDRYIEIYGLSADVVKPGISLHDILEHRRERGCFAGSTQDYIEQTMRKMAAGEDMVSIVNARDGRTFCVTNRPTGGGGWVATHEDITERKLAENELNRARNMLRAVVDNIPEMLIVKEAKTGRNVFINRAGEDFLGITKDKFIGKTCHEVFSEDQALVIAKNDEEALRSGRIEVHQRRVTTLDGRRRDVIAKRVAIGNKDGHPEYLMSVIEDVTERKRNEMRIAHLAHHDPLTDLPNRAALRTHLSKTIERAVDVGEPFAVLYIDLDRFKEVNDIYGHAAGDSVLVEISRRMQTAIGDTFLARLGGDEFMALCTETCDAETAMSVAAKLVGSVAGDIDCDGRKVQVGMSIGIARFPEDGTDSVTLFRNADAALYRAKARGRNKVVRFEAEMDRMLHDRRALQADLAHAVSRNELQLFFQPQALIGGQIIGFEALLRWDHLRRGFVPPDTFIPIAEETGLIDQIGEWVLREACREAASWPKPLQVAVNLSPVQFRQSDFVSVIQSVLVETGLPSERLVVEITEGALMDDYGRAISILRRIKALGVRIAMDDFGTGYSSLSYLQSFPFDKIKIDQTFISNLENNAQSAAIVRAVLGLGQNLHLVTVAEGVETPEQLAILRREGCDEMQGYLIGRPLPIDNYADLVGRAPPDIRRAS